jgi:cysteinyl-tRNA synthetase
MDDDFSTPQAIAVLFDLSRDVNTLLSEKRAEPEAIVDAEYLFSSLGGDVLGIIPKSLEASQTELQIKNIMEVLVELRENLRENKDFASADLIRERLQKIGIEFKDLPEGTTWEMTDKN